MAIENEDGLSGSLGNVVFYKRKGKKCRRTKPEHFNDAKTQNQLNHREKMRRSSQFLKSCLSIINIGYQATDQDSQSNEARSFIVKNCFIKGNPLPVLDFSKVQISRGLISAPENVTMTQQDSTVTITWKVPVKGESSNRSDNVIVVMYADDKTESKVHALKNVAQRIDGTVTLKIPKSSSPLHVWMFFSWPDESPKENKSKISDSVYLGVIE